MGYSRELSDRMFEQIFSLLHEAPVPEAVLRQRIAGTERSARRLSRALAILRHDGWVVRQPDGTLSVRTRVGTLRVNPRGFGFVTSSEYPDDDVFVPQRYLASANQGDEVLVWFRRQPGAPGPEGRIVRVLKRVRTHVVGRLERIDRDLWAVLPQDPREPFVIVPREETDKRWRPGLVAACRITEWGAGPDQPARGRIEEVIGEAGSPGTDVRALMVQYGLPGRFPPSVLQEAERLPSAVRAEDMVGREDLRGRFIVTIDGEDAKDLDDAISVERLDHGYRVGVHIADVSYYVPEGSALDLEARQRGTSVYLVDRVIPMLPERLSNGIASLNPHEPRLTLTCWVDLNERGEPVQTRLQRSCIESRHRLTYPEVNAWLASGAPPGDELGQFLHLAREVRDRLYRRRLARGAVDFDLPEIRVVLDERGYPVTVEPRGRGLAESIIEEFMLLANEAVARELVRWQLPGLFRVHQEPEGEKMAAVRALVEALGYRLPKTVTPKALQGLLRAVKGKPEERVVNSVLLRSMQQARYEAVNIGHFGLASKEYTHFTSPIRRYPDLWVHRILARHLEGTLTEEDKGRLRAMVDAVGEMSSLRERNAMEAERESVQMKVALYMRDRIGETFSGVVSGVTNFGIFVELPNLIEGLIRIEDLPRDAWRFDGVRYLLRGERTGRVYQLGQPVEVVVAAVDVALRRIDFALAPSELRGYSHRVPAKRRSTPRDL
ncbi:MAG: ribonuclease R [Firmicutes bacterium]|nr:ribonuclease R [Bacillota bacterium]